MAPKPSKTTAAWWHGWLSNQQLEKHSFPNTNLDHLGKRKSGRYLQLRSFTFLHHRISTRDHFRLCPKLWFLEMWAQMGQITNQTRHFRKEVEILTSVKSCSLLACECWVLLADIQDPNSSFNHMLCQDSTINLLEVLNRPTTDVDFWAAFLRGKDGWLQPLKLYATYSGVKQLSGKTKTTWNRSALVEVLCGYQSQHLALRSNSFVLSNFSQV